MTLNKLTFPFFSCVSINQSLSLSLKGLMTTLMMPSDYGVEMYLGSSPVLTSSYLAAPPFLHDYRLPLQSASPPCQPTPLQANPLHSIWGHSNNTTTNNNNNNSCFSSSFRSSHDGPTSAPSSSSLSCSSEYNQGLFTRNSFR